MLMFSKKLYTNKKTGDKTPLWEWQWKATYLPRQEELDTFQAEYRKTDKVGKLPVEVAYQFNSRTMEMLSFSEIDQSQVRFFTLFKTADPRRQIHIVMQEGMKVIIKRRRTGIAHLEREVINFVFGYKQGKHSHYSIVLLNGDIYTSSKDNIDLPDLTLYP